MRSEWIANYEGNEIKITNSWITGEKLFVNNEIISINDSFDVYLQGVKAYYDSAAFTGNNIQFRILAGNKLKFSRAQGGRRVEVKIKNRFKI